MGSARLLPPLFPPCHITRCDFLSQSRGRDFCWCYDCVTDDYVVTLYSVYGGSYVVWVDATTGAAWQIA